MRKFALRFLVNALALWLTGFIAYQINPKDPGIIVSPYGAVAAVVVLSFLNLFVAPILRILALPLTCMTLGLFGFLINAFLFWMASELIPDPHFAIRGFLAALLGPVVMGLLSGVLHLLLPGD